MAKKVKKYPLKIEHDITPIAVAPLPPTPKPKVWRRGKVYDAPVPEEHWKLVGR